MKHLPALDGLRAVAILIVATSHIVTSVVPGGFGVTLFFFISGFIITRMMFAQDFGWGSIKGFYVRRFFRLAPALFAFIAISGVTMRLLGHVIPLQDYLATLFYYANYHSYAISADFLSPFVVTWSLAIEEHFYFGFPLLFLLSGRRLVACLATIIVAVALWRCALVFVWHAPTARTYCGTDARIDSIAWGCLLSCLIQARSKVLDVIGSRAGVACGLALLLASFAVRNDAFRETIRYSLQGAGLFPLFCALFWTGTADRRVQAVLESRPARFIGNISYSLYLYHFLALCVMMVVAPGSVAVRLLALPLGLALATASYYGVENPLRRYGSRLAKSLEKPNPGGGDAAATV